MSNKVFISYPRNDTEWAEAFAEALKTQHVDVWLDQRNIKPGDSWKDALEEALRQSDIHVALVSPSNVKSPGLLFELGAALSLGKRLILIVSNDLDESLIPFNLRSRRYLHKGSPTETAREVASAFSENT